MVDNYQLFNFDKSSEQVGRMQGCRNGGETLGTIHPNDLAISFQ